MSKYRRRRPVFLEFDLDLDDPMIRQAIPKYADRYVRFEKDHYTLDDFAEQVALDLQMPAAKRLVKEEIRKQELAQS